MRDHINHCIPVNGGMWGATRGAVQDMNQKVLAWRNRDMYGNDLDFLGAEIWPMMMENPQETVFSLSS